MRDLRIKPSLPDARGVVLDITPQSAGWAYVGFRLVRLSSGQSYLGHEAGRECCIVVLTGTATIAAGGETFDAVGLRTSVFENAPPGAVYVPHDTPFRIEAQTFVEIALCTAPGRDGLPAYRIKGKDRFVRGKETNTRLVRNILSEEDEAHGLLVVEVITPSGHWSSYPPHKHDTVGVHETALEETYYHRIKPAQGFAFQRVYTDDRSLDETICIEDGDVVLVPRGYHPVGTPHGYELYYLNVMAGPVRQWKFHNDPAHEWIFDQK